MSNIKLKVFTFFFISQILPTEKKISQNMYIFQFIKKRKEKKSRNKKPKATVHMHTYKQYCKCFSVATMSPGHDKVC